MKKFRSSKAFTILELMVSIFITVMIIASFYKLYNASVRTERAASIRVAVNLMGEQMIDTITEAVRLTGLNSAQADFKDSGTYGDEDIGIIRYAGEHRFKFLSPFGSPITKVKDIEGVISVSGGEGGEGGEGGTGALCNVTLFNSAAFYNGVNKLYFHNENGFFKTLSVGTPNYMENGVKLTVTFAPHDDLPEGAPCLEVFPRGSLVTGEDLVYTLEYSGDEDENSLKLSYAKESSAPGVTDGTLVDFSFKKSEKNNYYSMPKFVMEYLVEEYPDENDKSYYERNWKNQRSGELTAEQVKGIVAVRFGFVLLSRKERIYTAGSESDTPGKLPTYCIFKDTGDDDYYCYQLKSLNYTVSVFRKVVYLSNYRFLKDQTVVE